MRGNGHRQHAGSRRHGHSSARGRFERLTRVAEDRFEPRDRERAGARARVELREQVVLGGDLRRAPLVVAQHVLHRWFGPARVGVWCDSHCAPLRAYTSETPVCVRVGPKHHHVLANFTLYLGRKVCNLYEGPREKKSSLLVGIEPRGVKARMNPRSAS